MAARNVYSVSQVNAYIKNMFAQDYALGRISVRGEISNLKYHGSGHIYFTLKDAGAALSAVMFRSYAQGLGFHLREGQKVTVSGSIEVYERAGVYQLYAREIREDGEGDLFRKFEELRKRLEEMGMFAAEYKKPIPKYVRTVGIVTADTGAAIHDIMNIASRRNPYVQLILCPAKVQGEGAAESIARGIAILDGMGLDVLIVGRGGGSIEDLWAFNEEITARAIFAARTPVISAVGHETDVTIADYVADLRAPTPSAAAELAVYDVNLLESQIADAGRRLGKTMLRTLEVSSYRLRQYSLKLEQHSPARELNARRQRLAEAEERMEQSLARKLRARQQDVVYYGDNLERSVDRRLAESRRQLAGLAERLDAVSPLKKVSAGFGFLTDGADRRICSVNQVKPGDRMSVRILDGAIRARVEEVEEYGKRTEQ